MNYLKIYQLIIHNAKTESRYKTINYYERHHIVPRSLGGSDDEDNLVLLTAREHFLCHWLLYRMTEGTDKSKMAHAWFSMCRISKDQKRTKITSRKFEYAKRAHAKAASAFHKGRNLSQKELNDRKYNNPRARKVCFKDICFTSVKNAALYYGVQPSVIRKVESGELPYQYLYDTEYRLKCKGSKISQSLKGKNKGKTYEEIYGIEAARHLKEQRRQNKIGYTHSEETRKKLSESRRGKSSWNKGKSFSEESRKKMSDARKGIPHNRLKYTVITPNGERIDIDETVGIRKWLKDKYGETISTSIKNALKTEEPVKRGKWKGYSFYAEARNP